MEVLASGVPIIMYKAGGALEYLKPNINGVFFNEQSIDSLADSIQQFESKEGIFETDKIKQSANSFSDHKFKLNIINQTLPLKFNGEVMEGKKQARKIGFATANIQADTTNLPAGI